MNIKTITIKEIKHLNKESSFSATGIVSRFSKRKDRNDNSFWDLSLSDSTGDLDCKIWGGANWWNLQNGSELPINPDDPNLKFEGSVVTVTGKITQFKEQLQYNINVIYYLDQSKISPAAFSRRSPISDNELEEKFLNLLTLVNPPLNDFLEAVFFKHNLWDDFKTFPAAVTIHHAYKAGLLEHSLSVAYLALQIAKHYNQFKIPVNQDLVIAGGLLHDLGKLQSYSYDSIPQMTLDGNLAGHIVLGYEKFMNIAKIENLNPLLTKSLAHIILSHHGKLDFGSPVPPTMPEAMIINSADDLDFKLNYWRSQIENLNTQSELTDYLPLLERRFWKGYFMN